MPSVQQCTICFDELTNALTATPCGHVFHTVCIDKWHGTRRFCPICHENLPPKLIKLFYEPQRDSPADTAAISTAGGGCSTSLTRDAATGKRDLGSCEELTNLRRKAASSEKLVAIQEQELKDLKRRLSVAEAEAMESKEVLKETIAVSEAKLEATRIDLFKTNVELTKLKREMAATGQQLRELQAERAGHVYLSQFSSPSRGRTLDGPGETDAEEVLRQISQGNLQASTVIRGQHKQLCVVVDREQRTLQALRKSKEEGKCMTREIQSLRFNLAHTMRESYRLERTLAVSSITRRDLEQESSFTDPDWPSRSLFGDIQDYSFLRTSPSEENSGSEREGWRSPVGVKSTPSAQETVPDVDPTGVYVDPLELSRLESLAGNEKRAKAEAEKKYEELAAQVEKLSQQVDKSAKEAKEAREAAAQARDEARRDVAVNHKQPFIFSGTRSAAQGPRTPSVESGWKGRSESQRSHGVPASGTGGASEGTLTFYKGGQFIPGGGRAPKGGGYYCKKT